MKNLELKGKKFCFTGECSNRDLFIKTLESQGMEYSTEINESLDFLFVGKNAGSRVVKAKTFDNIKGFLINEENLNIEDYKFLKDLKIEDLFLISFFIEIGNYESFLSIIDLYS